MSKKADSIWLIKMTEKIQAGHMLTKKQAIRYFCHSGMNSARRFIFDAMRKTKPPMTKATHQYLMKYLAEVERQMSAHQENDTPPGDNQFSEN